MIKHEYCTTVEIGDDYEFCVIIDGISNVKYGRVISICKDTKSFKFSCIKRGKKITDKILTDEIYSGITAVRGIGYVHKDTWEDKYVYTSHNF